MPDCRLCACESNRVFLLVGAASDQAELNEIIETTFFVAVIQLRVTAYFVRRKRHCYS